MRHRVREDIFGADIRSFWSMLLILVVLFKQDEMRRI